ncbi:MAG: 4-hydroxy-tetrahydrodipicolinate reductase [Thermoguttaceae bacterium]
MISLGIIGAAGRMGQRLVALGTLDPNLKIIAAVENQTHTKCGEDAGLLAGVGAIGVSIAPKLTQKVDAVIDFSSPEAVESTLLQCLEYSIPLVLATTGLTPPQHALIQTASETIPILVSPSMSMTVNLAMNLCQKAGMVLRDYDADVEIIEKHHRFKTDSPSGTALKFGSIISEQMALTESKHGREGQIGVRPHQEIGYHAVRIGDNPGEHTILFGLIGETLEISVKASNRDCYAKGAFAAAIFLQGKKPGLYNMNDVLGL